MKTQDQDTVFAANTVDEQIVSLSETQDEQLLSSSLNARMVHDLYQVYEHTSYSLQVERSLEHIWQRFELKRTQSAEVDEQHAQQGKATASIQQTKRYARPESARTVRSPFVSRLASLAAVLFVVLLIGSLVLTLLATRHHGSNTVGNPELETVSIHMGPASFLPPSVILRPGMRVQLVNDTSVLHVIENGYWKVDSIRLFLHEPGMPKSPILFSSTHETHLIGPFNTVGTYHLFDSIHVSMNLTVIVQQFGSPTDSSSTPPVDTVRVYMEQQTFRPGTITIQKGKSLLLINETLIEHIIMNGYWKDNHAVYVVAKGRPVPQQVLRNLHGDSSAMLEYVNGQGMPSVNIVFQAEHPEQVIGPFTTTGIYFFFDPIHVNMNLMVVVQS